VEQWRHRTWGKGSTQLTNDMCLFLFYRRRYRNIGRGFSPMEDSELRLSSSYSGGPVLYIIVNSMIGVL
ncbi:MAG: hypothetical protein MJA29_08395, partial [Candidatus Omnitrophica bacterium]|nr:hypothetical protein [Candidatus Omnitrophota bacterium]